MENTDVTPDLEQALETVSRLAGGSVTRALSGVALIAFTGQVEALGRLVDALRVEAAHEIDARTFRTAPADPKDSLAHSYGFSSSRDFLKQITLASGQTIARRIRVGRQCRTEISLLGFEHPAKFQHLGEAFFQGEMNIDTADTVSRELGRLPSHVGYERVDLAERVLVSHATGRELAAGVWEDAHTHDIAGGEGVPVHADDVRQLTAGWVAALDQDGTLPREEQIGRRFVTIGKERHGLVPVWAALLPEVAAGLGRMFDAINNPRSATDTTAIASATTPSADPNTAFPAPTTEAAALRSGVRFVPVTGNDSALLSDDEADGGVSVDTRTPDQKRHDALATIFQIAMQHEAMPQQGGAAVTLVIQAREEHLLAPGGTAWLTDSHGGLTPIDTSAARHAGCAGSILRVTHTETGRIIALDTHDRVFNATQRKAIAARDGGCIIPGCSVSAIWCEIHHVTEWANGGPTHTDNGVLLCWFHHRHLETHGWQIQMIHGMPQVKAPAWLDPDSQWRQPRSIHKSPPLADRTRHTTTRNLPDRSSETSLAPRPGAASDLVHDCAVTADTGRPEPKPRELTQPDRASALIRWVNLPTPFAPVARSGRRNHHNTRQLRSTLKRPPSADMTWTSRHLRVLMAR